jgi:outer membrane lipoprotein-sorting protein
MKRSIVFMAAGALVLLVGAAFYPDCASAETWESLSKRMTENCTKNQQGIKDLSWEMEMDVPSSEGSLKSSTLLYSKGPKFRVEISMEGMEDMGMPAGMGDMKTIVIGDGKSAWIVNPMMGKSQIPPEEAEKYRAKWSCSDYMPVAAKIVGSEKVGGADCWVLSVMDESSEYAKLWIEQGGLRIMKMEGKPQEGVATTILFSDYRKVSGAFEMPYKTVMYSGKDMISTAVVKSAKVNSGLSDELFDASAIKVTGPGSKDMMEQMKKMQQKLEEGEGK